jgi:hypothetical protein
MARLLRLLVALTAIVLSSSCLVVSVNPVYDDMSIAWEPNLIGNWIDEDDKASLQIERSEWKSYKIHYVHPIETGDLTGYLTVVGEQRFLDVMPARGSDRGSFLLPLHAIIHVKLDGDRLQLAPLAYDWLADPLRAGKQIAGLNATLDQKDNVLLVTPVDRLREWLRGQSVDGPAFGAAATFKRSR